MRTLRGRLLLGTAVGTGLVLSASALALYMVVRAALWAEFDEALISKARSLSALVEQDRSEIETDIDEADLPEFRPSDRAEYYELRPSDGRVMARSSSLGEEDLPRLGGRTTEPLCRNMVLPDGRPGRIVAFTFIPRQEGNLREGQPDMGPQTLTLSVARDTLETDRTLDRLAALLVFGCLGAIVVAVGVLAWFVRRGLGPLEEVATQIAAIGESDLSTRLDACGAPGELAPFIARLNDLLARLETAFAREKAFTADVAHELRTPLAGLRSTFEVSLSRERPADSYREALAKSLAICEQMQRMVENLLELARADAGQLEVARENVDLVALLKDCWGEFAYRAAERDLRVTFQLPESCRLTTDRTRFRLVLSNVFDNAVTYTDAGGELTIALHVDDGQVRARVANTGSYVAEADTDRVFDRFWRGDTARTSDADGRRYGLGLPLCQKLITLLGGSISVSTATGGTFAVTASLPR